METAALVSLMVFVLIGSAAVLLIAPREGAHERIERRLAAYAAAARQQAGFRQALSVLRERRYSRVDWLDALLGRLNVAGPLARTLRQAGVPMRPGEFLLLQLAVAAAGGLAATLAVPLGPTRLATVMVVAVAAFFSPRLWLRLKSARRLATFERDLPEALDLVAGSLRAGYGIAHGLDLVARETTGPCAEEFGQVLQELNLGADLDVALARVVERVPSEDAQLLATAVAIQRRTGGNLVEVLGMITTMIRERLRLRGDVRTITTAPRISGYFVALLPVATAALMFVTSRYYVEMLFAAPLGRVALGISGTLTLIGLFLNHRIARVEL